MVPSDGWLFPRRDTRQCCSDWVLDLGLLETGGEASLHGGHASGHEGAFAEPQEPEQPSPLSHDAE